MEGMSERIQLCSRSTIGCMQKNMRMTTIRFSATVSRF